jgi:P-type Cu2+ transporter
MSALSAIAPAVDLRDESRGACAHCGVSVPAAAGRFCCHGCEAAYGIVQGLGLSDFYARREIAPTARALRPDDEPEADLSEHVRVLAGGRYALTLLVDGLTCAACVWLIESVLARESALLKARVNLTTRRLTLEWIGAPADAMSFVRRVRALGFRLVPFGATVTETDPAERELLRAMAVAGFAAGNVMLLSVSVWAGHVEGMGVATRDLMHWVSALIALPAIAYAGRPFFRSALAALSAGRTNMDVPISIGVTLVAGMSLFETMSSGLHAYFDSGITLLFFLLVGRYLDRRARARARSSVEQMVALAGASVAVLDDRGVARRCAASRVRPGDRVLVAAGERIGVDGEVYDGRSDVDTSLVTGESVPEAVSTGAVVYAGTLNLTAPLKLRVRAVGPGTMLAEIVRLLEIAERGRGRFVALADRVARLYAPVVHIVAAATFAGWMLLSDIGWQASLLISAAVLIITCPCALALAVPVVQVVASGRLTRRGILLKSATALERLALADTVVLDKTGTLTLGRLELDRRCTPDDGALRVAASLARASRHPLAQAFARAAGPGAVCADVREHPGEGLSAGVVRLGHRRFCGVDAAEGDATGPELWLSRPGHTPVRFVFRDHLRDDAAACVAALRRMGLQVLLLSGDRAPVVSAVAGAAGIDQWVAGCTPAEKAERLAALRAAGRKVLMVGDGLNDAPALAAASVSLSPSSAADIAKNAADAVFQGELLAPVVETIVVARRARTLVAQNLALAIGYNCVAVPLAILGHVTPLIAAIAMSSSSLLVIANALRLALGTKR